MKHCILLLAATLLATPASAYDSEDLNPYPPTMNGKRRIVIELPQLEDEDLARMEISFSKILENSDCNKKWVNGTIKEGTIEGWGYPYWEVNSNGDIAGTLMGCGDRPTKTERVFGAREMIRYNSRLPLVIYVPEGLDAAFRTFTTPGGFQTRS
ncbi:ecotin family protein [Sorangium sp. So ce1099]|uniref:ecotin family protein n=1 Tax=Sorangium sp. So ce1099 TaxID=3133331 RepID=UPI003F62ADAA